MKNILCVFLSICFTSMGLAKDKEVVGNVSVIDYQQVVINKAYNLFNANKKEQAIDIIEKQLEKQEALELRILKIAFLQKTRSSKEVNKYIDETINRYPNKCEFKIIKASYVNNNDFEKVLSTMDYKNIENIDKEECFGYIGVSLLKANKSEEARFYITKALSFSNNIKWQKLLALIGVKENNYQVTQEELEILEMD